MQTSTPFIDVDGHIAEPQTLWQDYIEPKYRDRTLQILEDDQGLEYLSIDGVASWFGRGGTLGALCAIGQDVTPFLTPGKVPWSEALIPGGYDPHARIEVMDAEGIDKTLIYPSLGLLWGARLQRRSTRGCDVSRVQQLGVRLLPPLFRASHSGDSHSDDGCGRKR